MNTQASSKSLSLPVHYDTRHLWAILLHFQGSVWGAVIPYCILNCGITYLAYYLTLHGIRITFSVQGHALMSLIVSYLVVSKVYLSLDRYMAARTWTGHALMGLRELNQLALTFTEGQSGMETRLWRRETGEKIVELLNSTIRVIRDKEKASFLARNTQPATDDDPMVHAQLLRSHLYHDSDVLPRPLHILEKCKLLDGLSNYLNAYREVLKLASTPLPFTMIQMGRTFLFLWTFTMPFALVRVIDGIVSVLIFVFFLTYGFIGLEFVSMKLLHPFGDGINDIDIVGMGEAVVYGMGSDSRLVLDSPTSKRGGSRRKNLDDSFLAPDHSQSTMGSGDQVGDHDQAAHYYAFHS